MTVSRGWFIASLLVVVLAIVVAGVVGGVVGFAASRMLPAPATSAVVSPISASNPSTAPASPNAPAAPAQPAQPTAPLSANADDAVVKAVAKVKPAVVRISVGQGSGSGVIIDNDGHILTNNHVVEGAGRVTSFDIRFDNGSTAKASVVGVFPASDVAILKVNGAVPAFAPLGDSNQLKAGERVIAIGSPLGEFSNSVTTGIVSATNRSVGGLPSLIQHDAPISPGNSGGPLINLAGEVVGINTAVVRGAGMTGAVAEGLGFAVPSAIAKVVAERLIAGQPVDWPFLGISLDGTRVASVDPSAGAARAGMREGDVITAIEGAPVSPDTPISAVLIQYQVGQTVRVEVQRDGQSITLNVTLGKRPNM